MSVRMADLYNVNTSKPGTAPVTSPSAGTVAPDARDLSSAAMNGTAANGPAFSWVALVATLVAIRLLQEYAE